MGIIHIPRRGTTPTSLKFFSFVTSSASDGSSIIIPSGVQANDVLVITDYAAAISPVSVTPTGFTLALSTSATEVLTNISYKLANGTEGSLSVTGMSGVNQTKQCLVFRPQFTPTSLIHQDTAGQATSATPTNQTLNASAGAGYAVIALAHYYGSDRISTFSARGFSPAADGETQVEYSLGTVFERSTFVKYKNYTSFETPSDHTISVGDNGSNVLQSLYLRAQ